ncbi:PQQ-binding-like beta-propeller repeat protein [Thalassoglobus sp. JC818]|uniref:outer membrane protein assembly factor BamB family protein n=1 Tax=Thalassoglobus sp. JC818 TaxID=3232136 RepID=UPI0034591CE3
MTKLTRQVLLVAVLLLGGNSLNAQTLEGMPKETELNRYGLTLSWWGQAINDARRDTILHINSDEQNVYLQSTSGILTTFNGETGRRLWSTLVGVADQRAFAAESNERELLVASGMNVHSYDKLNGELLWELKAPQFPSASPTVSDTQVFIGTVEGSVYAFNLRKVRELHQENMLPRWSLMSREWRFKTPKRIISPPIHSGNTVLFASERGTVYGLSDLNKELKFQFETDARITTPLGSIDEYVLVADENSRLFCLNQSNGRTRWTFSSGSVMNQRPTAVGNHVYIIPNRKGMFALYLESGRVLWNQPQATQFISASDTRVYASDFNGNLLILNREDGTVIGKVAMRDFPNRIVNERTDRIVVSSKGGLVLGIREVQAEFPIFHAHPERRPILPEMASDEEQSTDQPPEPAN